MAKLAGFIWLLMVVATESSRPLVFKTVKTTYGDVYDCVDAHRQPSLQHPALKGHKVQMRLSTLGKELVKVSGEGAVALEEICPLGSVPVRRMLPTLKNSTTLAEDSNTGTMFAGLATIQRTQVQQVTAYYSVHNPKVGPGQRSAAVLALEYKSGVSFSRVEVGWTVSPGLYGDTQTRFFTRWTTDLARSTGCFNTACPGFVATSGVPLDFVFTNISEPFKTTYFVKFGFIVDPWNELVSVIAGESDVRIGYWPFEIVPDIGKGDVVVRWGGEVYRPNTGPDYPQMGSGTFDTLWKEKNTAFVSNILLYNNAPSSDSLAEEFGHCYWTSLNYVRPILDYSFLYGGSGGDMEATSGLHIVL